jgi:hypothetical protein
MSLLIISAILFVFVIVLYGIYFAIQSRPRRRRESGFEYIYVEDDGSARELDADEQRYLNTKFHGGDGNRPYIKLNYEAVTPDGYLRGYLRRRQLPKDIPIRPNTK